MTQRMIERRSLIAGGAAALFAPRAWSTPASPPPRAMRCADFLDTIGVNLHLGYPATPYNDVASVAAAMSFCGIRFARDSAVYDRAPNAEHYGALAARGVRFCFLWGSGRSMADEMRQLDRFEAEHPGAVDALEGPNEIKPSFAYSGLSGVPAAQKFMSDMRTEAAKYERLRRKPIVAFTGYSGYDCDCDIANVHIYPKGGQQPGDILRLSHRRWVGPGGFMPGKRMFFTEFGYHTIVGKAVAPSWQGVDQQTQAVLLLNGWFDAANAGVARTYAYELFDERVDRGGAPRMENHFGLFESNGTPKRAALALKRLTTIIGDPSSTARTFRTSPFPFVIDAPGPIVTTHLQDARGRNFLCLSNPAPVWLPEIAAPARVAFENVRILLPNPAPSARCELLTDSPGTEISSSREMQFSLGGSPIVIRIG